MKKALIDNGVVTNVIRARPGFDVPGMNLVDCPDECGPGWLYADGQFTAPPEPEPVVQPPSRQAVLIETLKNKGILTDDDLAAAQASLIDVQKNRV